MKTKIHKADNQHFEGNGVKLGERLTLIFVLNDSRLKKSQLVSCKMKTRLHLFNRVVQEIETTCKNYWKFESKCE